MLADGVVDVQVDDKHEEEGRDVDPKEDEVDQVIIPDNLREGTVREVVRALVPSHGGNQAHQDGCDPGDDHHVHGSLDGQQPVVVERVSDGDKALQRYGGQVEDGDVGDENDEGVDEDAGMEVSRQAAEDEDGGGRDDQAHQHVGGGQAADEAVGDGAQSVRLEDGQQHQAVAQRGEHAYHAL